MCVFIWVLLISGADEASKPDNDFFLLWVFMWFRVGFFNPLNYERKKLLESSYLQQIHN